MFPTRYCTCRLYSVQYRTQVALYLRLQNLSIRYMFSSHNNYNTKLLKVQLRCQPNQQVVLDPFPKVDIAGIIQDTGRM